MYSPVKKSKYSTHARACSPQTGKLKGFWKSPGGFLFGSQSHTQVI